jgi:hypothetical protein
VRGGGRRRRRRRRRRMGELITFPLIDFNV